MRIFLWDTLEAAGIAFDALKANKVRSFLSVLGVVIGVMTVILMVSIVQGINLLVGDLLAGMGGRTLYVERLPWINVDIEDYFKRPPLTVRDFEAVLNQSQLAEAISPVSYLVQTVSYGSQDMRSVILIGTSDEFIRTHDVLPEYGRFFSAADNSSGRDVTVIGAAIADRFFRQRSPVGQELRTGTCKFRVIGVLEKKGATIGQNQDNEMIIPLGSLMKHFGRKHDLQIVVKARSEEEIEELKSELTGIMRRSRHLGPKQKDNFSINEPEQLMTAYKDNTFKIFAIGIAIGGISLLVAGIGIMNIMLVSVTERTHEIGIRKALGARRSQIMRQFLIESALICAVGGAVGVGFAWFATLSITQFFKMPMSLSVVVGGILFAAGVGVFFGLYPAAKAARMNPIEALRRE